MKKKPLNEDLAKEHTIEAIRNRLQKETQHNYLGDFILGGVDGTVTTFAVISSIAGAGLSSKIALILGISNLLADGFSMAAGAYLKARTDENLFEKAKRKEEAHLDLVPEGEKEEMREIFRRKGIDGPVLEDVVQTLFKSRKHWINMMLTEELGLRIKSPSPFKVGLMTFLSFFLVGFSPLFPYLFFPHWSPPEIFQLSSLFTAIVFFTIGTLKGKNVGQSMILSGLETLLLGGVAATLAYAVGFIIKQI